MREPRGPATKFLYASGSRPLEGYTVKRGIGRGGFGEVYYATSDGGKEVALKLIRRNLDVELRGVAHCLNLKHPNLLALFDIKTDADDDTWVVMEYLHGDTLDQVIARHPQGMPLADVLTWLQGIAAGVGYLHDHGIVHRDLKPGNIFCDEGIVKLGDYGLSKFISTSRRSGQTESVGTVHYMAPEVANGRYGKEIDIYALGVILYEMLSGRVPFEGESVGEVLMKHLTASPDVSTIAEPFRSLVARMLDKDPARRPQSMSEVLAALPASGATTATMYTAVAGPAAPPMPLAGPTVTGATLIESASVHEEPIWKAVKSNWSELERAWREADLNWFVRGVILVLVAVMVLSTMGVWFPALLVYAVYRIVRSILIDAGKGYLVGVPLGNSGLAVPPQPQPASSAPQPASGAGSAPEKPAAWRRVLPESPAIVLPMKTGREKITELVGSMLLGALVAVLACFAMDMFLAVNPSGLAWLALVSTAGTWLVMFAAKSWEHQEGDEFRRRAVMVLVGLLLGFYAWTLDRVLMVDLSYSLNPALRVHVPVINGRGGSSPLFDAYGAPRLAGYLAYFGILFLGPRWWRLADPLRERRFRIWTVLAYGLWAYVLHLFWPFPEQFAVAVAMTMALALQLGSPWFDRRARLKWNRS
jgi:hypothetical protein